MLDTLKLLKEERVFSAELSTDRMHVIIEEECDGCFRCNLNKEQMIALAHQMLIMANHMKE